MRLVRIFTNTMGEFLVFPGSYNGITNTMGDATIPVFSGSRAVENDDDNGKLLKTVI